MLLVQLLHVACFNKHYTQCLRDIIAFVGFAMEDFNKKRSSLLCLWRSHDV